MTQKPLRIPVAPIYGIPVCSNRFEQTIEIVRRAVENLSGEISRFEIIDALTDDECKTIGRTREELRSYSPENRIDVILCLLERNGATPALVEWVGESSEFGKKDYRPVYRRL